LPEAYPEGFSDALGKLEQALEVMVGPGTAKQRLDAVGKTLAPLSPDDLPEGYIREEYASIYETLTWVPPKEGSGQGLAESTLDAMIEAEAGALGVRLFYLYLDARVLLRE
jgi:hypothetical protein